MKYFAILSFLVVVVACHKKPTEDPAQTVINPAATTEQAAPSGQPGNNGVPHEQHQASGPQGIVEENDSCICTKEWKPVCANGQTFPSACQAKCEGIADYTEGTCPKNE